MGAGGGEGGERRKRKQSGVATEALGGLTPWANWSLRFALAAYAATLAVGVAIALVLSTKALELGLGVLLLDAALLSALIPLYCRGSLTLRVLGFSRPPLGRMVWLVWGALIAYGLFAAIWVHVASVPTTIGRLQETTPELVLTGFALSLCAPVVEEIFFRGLLYGALRSRLNAAPAILIGGVLFGAVHATTYPLNTLPVKAVAGVLFCWLYERTGSLLPGIMLHCFIDALAFEELISGSGAIVGWSFISLSVLLLISAAIRRRRHQPPVVVASAVAQRDAREAEAASIGD
jgi:membrane protease YdiL (CAAX protease family)